MVCGSGAVDTDTYGRIKVRFHWNEHASVYLRVAQRWAGKQWGWNFVPHVGHEVVVQFLEGDPDRPLITGSVYNAANPPPLDLPARKHDAIIRDESGNQFVMSSETGSEYIQLKDKCGNEIKLDSSEKILRLYTPSKNTSATFGHSLEWITDSSLTDAIWGYKNKMINGNSFGCVGGNNFGVVCGEKLGVIVIFKLDVIVGWNQKYVIGAENKLVLGAAWDWNLGGKKEARRGKKFEFNPNGGWFSIGSDAVKKAMNENLRLAREKLELVNQQDVAAMTEKVDLAVNGMRIIQQKIETVAQKIQRTGVSMNETYTNLTDTLQEMKTTGLTITFTEGIANESETSATYQGIVKLN